MADINENSTDVRPSLSPLEGEGLRGDGTANGTLFTLTPDMRTRLRTASSAWLNTGGCRT